MGITIGNRILTYGESGHLAFTLESLVHYCDVGSEENILQQYDRNLGQVVSNALALPDGLPATKTHTYYVLGSDNIGNAQYRVNAAAMTLLQNRDESDDICRKMGYDPEMLQSFQSAEVRAPSLFRLIGENFSAMRRSSKNNSVRQKAEIAYENIQGAFDIKRSMRNCMIEAQTSSELFPV